MIHSTEYMNTCNINKKNCTSSIQIVQLVAQNMPIGLYLFIKLLAQTLSKGIRFESGGMEDNGM